MGLLVPVSLAPPFVAFTGAGGCALHDWGDAAPSISGGRVGAGGVGAIGQSVSLLWPGTYKGPFWPHAARDSAKTAKIEEATASSRGRRGKFRLLRMTAI
jgi:hypothetical protein